ncbi:hypothetical protein Dxin01_04313 [Deinococcus xinjiangensis]|uniref:Uncharacterized protein n=1 Tax=Deinococcus xinjiangensis TaxID=457454 RepID=A0ABP9VH44_9DEIO
MTMYEMRRMGITYGSLKTVKMSTIQNMQAVKPYLSLNHCVERVYLSTKPFYIPIPFSMLNQASYSPAMRLLGPK